MHVGGSGSGREVQGDAALLGRAVEDDRAMIRSRRSVFFNWYASPMIGVLKGPNGRSAEAMVLDDRYHEVVGGPSNIGRRRGHIRNGSHYLNRNGGTSLLESASSLDIPTQFGHLGMLHYQSISSCRSRTVSCSTFEQSLPTIMPTSLQMGPHQTPARKSSEPLFCTCKSSFARALCHLMCIQVHRPARLTAMLWKLYLSTHDWL